jgi:hypothetical protein
MAVSRLNVVGNGDDAVIDRVPCAWRRWLPVAVHLVRSLMGTARATMAPTPGGGDAPEGRRGDRAPRSGTVGYSSGGRAGPKPAATGLDRGQGLPIIERVSRGAAAASCRQCASSRMAACDAVCDSTLASGRLSVQAAAEREEREAGDGRRRGQAGGAAAIRLDSCSIRRPDGPTSWSHHGARSRCGAAPRRACRGRQRGAQARTRPGRREGSARNCT